jgi:hypothetical protein
LENNFMALKPDRKTLEKRIRELEEALQQCRQAGKSVGEAEETARGSAAGKTQCQHHPEKYQ